MKVRLKNISGELYDLVFVRDPRAIVDRLIMAGEAALCSLGTVVLLEHPNIASSAAPFSELAADWQHILVAWAIFAFARSRRNNRDKTREKQQAEGV